MLEDLEKGDVAETIRIFFEKNKNIKAVEKSFLTLSKVDHFLDKLAVETTEAAQMSLFKSIALL
jgi:DNA ligase-3